MSSILLVSYQGVLGGAEKVLLDAATALGGEAIVACPAGPLAAAAQERGVTTLPLAQRTLRLRGGAAQSARAALALGAHGLELRRLVRELAPDLVVAWGMRSIIAALALPARTPLAIAHHDFLPGPAIAAAVRRAAARAQAITVPSQAIAADLDPGGRLADRIAVIAPGLDAADFAGNAPAPERPVVLLLGALAPWKRPDLALEAVALARRELPELELLVVGAPVTDDEPLAATLHRRAAEPDLDGAVTFLGARADPRPALARAACLLHCADAEPFGIVVIEALAAGRPVIAPDAAGPREILTAACGELYAPGDAAAAARALVRVLTDRPRALAMGDAGRRRVITDFSVTATQEGFRSALRPAGPARPRSAGGDLTLVTVTHNSQTALARLIASRDAHLPHAPLIVVDNASADASQAVARRGEHVTLIPLADNLGFGQACNRGVAAARTGAVALVNPDIELVDDSLATLAAEAMRHDRPERLLAPAVLGADGRRQDSAHPVPTSAPDLVRALIPPRALPGSWLAPWRARSPRPVGWAIGAALVARTSTLVRLGPFDPAIFLYGEDLELGLRARAAGVTTWLWPAGRVLHEGAHSSRAAFGGEAFARLADARQYAVQTGLGARRARWDRRAQAVTFATRVIYKVLLRRPSARERRQLEALRRPGRGR